MKRLLPALAVLLFPLSALAQEPPPAPATPAPSTTAQMIGADLVLAVPVGDFSDGAGLGIGALVRYEHNLIPKLNLTGRVGFVYHLSKDFGNGGKVNFSSIPVLVGAKYDLTDAIYAAVELGLIHNAATAKAGNVSISSSENDLGATVGGGFRIGDIDLRLGLHILDLSDASKSMALVVGAGYNFWHG
jgi:hypothetical protein